MSSHVLFNLFNDLGKSDKMWYLLSILSLFRNEFNKFNKTGARLLYSISITLNSHLGRENGRSCRLLRNNKKYVYVIT